MSSDPRTTRPCLSPDDERAVDALVQAGFDLSRVPGVVRDRAARVAGLLRLLDAPAAGPSLVDITMARVMQAGQAPASADASLSPDDQEAIDAWVAAGYRTAKVPSSLRGRAERLEALGALLTTAGEVRASPDLVARTLARVADAQVSTEPMAFGRAAPTRFRISDLVSIAAVVAIGGAVLWPVLTAMRNHSIRTDCAANLGLVASALGLYASDNGDSLPVAAAGFDGSWWHVGDPRRSNSANLFTLARERYASLDALSCPGNSFRACSVDCSKSFDWPELRAVSYSYQIMSGPGLPRWQAEAPTPVLSDRSPVVLRAVRGDTIYPMENSPNHCGKGQCVLRTDGSVIWMPTPVYGQDNIWLPAMVETAITRAREQVRRTGRLESFTLRGDELPAKHDVFLGP